MSQGRVGTTSISSHVAKAFMAWLAFVSLGGCAAPSPQADACALPLSSAIANSCVVTRGVLWRGAKPDVAGATALVSLGVRSVVNLELLHDDLSTLQSVRAVAADGQRIHYFRVRDWEPNVVMAPALLDEHVAEFLAIVRTQPRPIYVHCRSGQNRTGVMVAAYRIIEEGVPVENAIEEMKRYQGVWFKHDAEYLRGLAAQRRARLASLIAHQLERVQPDARLACTGQGCLNR